jgi:hypothetical protein
MVRANRPLRPTRFSTLLLGGVAWIGSIGFHPGLAAESADLARCGGASPGAQFLLAGAMLITTSLLQLAVSTCLAELTHQTPVITWCAPHRHRRSLIVLTGACVIGLTLLADILLWALLFRGLALFPTMESSFYFSGITFTSVGYGDLTLPSCWRLMSVGLGLNGLLMAGWSTALLVYLVQRMMALRLDNHLSR